MRLYAQSLTPYIKQRNAFNIAAQQKTSSTIRKRLGTPTEYPMLHEGFFSGIPSNRRSIALKHSTSVTTCTHSRLFSCRFVHFNKFCNTIEAEAIVRNWCNSRQQKFQITVLYLPDWRRGKNFPPNCWYLSTRPHSVNTHITNIGPKSCSRAVKEVSHVVRTRHNVSHILISSLWSWVERKLDV